MSARAVEWAQVQDAGGLGAKVALLLLADWANDDGLVIASLGRLANRIPTTDASVVRYVRALLADGLLLEGPVEIRDAQAKAKGVSPAEFGTAYVLALKPGVRSGALEVRPRSVWPAGVCGGGASFTLDGGGGR